MDTDGQTGGRTRPNLLPSTRSVTSISTSDRSVDTLGGLIGAAAWRVTEYLLHGTAGCQADVQPLQTQQRIAPMAAKRYAPPALAVSGGGHGDQWV